MEQEEQKRQNIREILHSDFVYGAFTPSDFLEQKNGKFGVSKSKICLLSVILKNAG